MSKESQAIRQRARQLVVLSLDERRQVSAERVGAVLQVVRKESPLRQRAILREYLKGVSREIGRHTAVIEHAGPVSQAEVAALLASLQAEAGRPLVAELRPNPDLVAGLRVTLGDHVTDASVAGSLERLAAGTGR